MDELYMNNGEWEKQDTKEYMLCDSISIKYKNQNSSRKQILKGSTVGTLGHSDWERVQKGHILFH